MNLKLTRLEKETTKSTAENLSLRAVKQGVIDLSVSRLRPGCFEKVTNFRIVTIEGKTKTCILNRVQAQSLVLRIGC